MSTAKTILYVGGAILGIGLLAGAITPVMMIVTAPGRVITDTFQTGNVTRNYEMFYDINAGHDRRVADISGHKAAMTSATGEEKNRLNVELLGMQQTCRDLVTRYNAESAKMNKAVFKSNSLPETLDINSCN